jgi:hypothetical protein
MSDAVNLVIEPLDVCTGIKVPLVVSIFLPLLDWTLQPVSGKSYPLALKAASTERTNRSSLCFFRLLLG